MANSAMTHLPQLKSICSDIIEVGFLLLLDGLQVLHTTPDFIALNFNWKNPVNRCIEYPSEQRDDSSRHRGKGNC